MSGIQIIHFFYFFVLLQCFSLHLCIYVCIFMCTFLTLSFLPFSAHKVKFDTERKSRVFLYGHILSEIVNEDDNVSKMSMIGLCLHWCFFFVSLFSNVHIERKCKSSVYFSWHLELLLSLTRKWKGGNDSYYATSCKCTASLTHTLLLHCIKS